jgi:PII-like signaling protein
VIDEDCLKLTTYFGERERADGRLLADVLLDIYEAQRVHTSILLRGAEGFGRLHHLRTDRLLSLSEDLPVVSVAVDRRERIEAVLAPLHQVHRKGLITLERVRRLTGEVSRIDLPQAPDEAVTLTVYVGRRERVHGRPAHLAICELMYRAGIAAASVLLGVDGTRHGRRSRARFFGRNDQVNTMIVAVGDGEHVGRVLPELHRQLEDPVITLERTRVCAREGRRLRPPDTLPTRDDRGREIWQKLTIHSSQDATVDGRSLHLEIIRRLRASQSAGATSLAGVWGFHGGQAPHGDRLLQIRRRVPMLTVTVDTPERTAAAFRIIDELTADAGLVTSEMVPALIAMSAARNVGGLELAAPGS